MEEDSVIALRQPGDIVDPLTEALRNGARIRRSLSATRVSDSA